uniref:NACHT domain-containing protein n=1 Tax=Biomphalaria glabrata TaxID=6526 RepID=A0A2C9JTF7_BIOGL
MENKRLIFDKILSGSLDNLPNTPVLSIRVFFSSTFTDMTEERNILMNRSVPEIRKYCSEKGFDFEVVDMRWGVREDAYADHKTTDICLREIENCQLTSAGPNFVVFVGDKYGTRPLPNMIPVTEFRLFRRLASWMDLKFETIEKWYLLDTNSVPPSYRIQSITTYLPHFNDMDPAHENDRLIHQNGWESEERNMKHILRKLAQVAFEQKKIASKDCNKYFVSVTENEIEKGIFSFSKIKDRVIYFHRTLSNINIQSPNAKRFIDLAEDGKIDEEARELREILHNKTLPAKVPDNQTAKFIVDWTAKGVDPKDERHSRYLSTLCETFESMMREQIDVCVKTAAEQKIENTIVAEALFHLQFCLVKCECFYGQEESITNVYQLMHTSFTSNESSNSSIEKSEPDLLEELQDHQDDINKEIDQRVQASKGKESDEQRGPTVGIGDVDYNASFDPDRNIKQHLLSFKMTSQVKQPVILYGESGCGKTSIMAQLALKVKTQHVSSVVIIRFLGTTSHSSNVRSLLISLLNNIWAAYKINQPADLDLSSDIIFLGHYLQALIWQVATPERPLYIFLDSLDQLSQIEQAHRLAWLPSLLPENASMVVSTLPNEYGCLQSARQRFSKTDHFVQVSDLKTEAANKVIAEVCNRKSRTLTRIQRNFLIEKFQKCPNPLYLRMIIDQALKWRSHLEVNDVIVGSDTNFAVSHVFIDLEREHGQVIVSKALGYLTSMRQGASMLEMEDILSLDDEVLQNTYIYHLPPASDFIRLPPSLWARIMMDVKDYMTGEGISGRLILTWYHRLFKQVATERYLNEENRLSIHRVIAEYFLGHWHNKCKPLKLFKGKTGLYPNSMRGVPEQPLIFPDGSLNRRKLQELPYHLALAGMWREYHKEIICNIDFLVAKIKAFGVSELKADLMFMSSRKVFLQDSEHVTSVHKTKLNFEESFIKETDLWVIEDKNMDEKMNRIDLISALNDLELLTAIVNIGVDSIRHNPNNLPVQIICQLGKDRATSYGMQKLVADAFKWIDDNNIPMLLPVDACMTSPGGMLQTSLNADIHLLGAERTHDFPVVHIKEDNYLYLIQQTSRQKDTFVVLDLKQAGETVLEEAAQGYVHSIRANTSEKFLIVCFYKELGKYDYKLFSRLYERSYLSPYKTDKEAGSIDVTASSDIVAYTHENACYVCSPNSEKLILMTLYQLTLDETILNVLFSPDAHYLVTFVTSDGFIVWLPHDGGSVFKNEGSKKQIIFSRDLSGQKVHITDKNKLLQVKSDYNNRNTLNVFDLVTGNLLYELQNTELKYSINFLELDKKEELVLVSSEEDVVTNGDYNKSAVLWDINSGKLLSLVTSTSPICATKVTIIHENIYIFVAHVRDPTIYVYNAGNRNNPQEKAKLIQQIQGHTKDIIQILLSAVDNDDSVKLITVSCDNSIKIWDLQQVIQPTLESADVNLGASTSLIYNKDGSKVYFTTEKGFLIEQSIQTGTIDPLDSSFGKAAHILLLSHDGNLLMAAVKNNIYVYSVETRKQKFVLKSCGHSDITCMSENNLILCAGHAGMEGTGRFWNLTDGTVIKDSSFLYSFYKAAISSDGKKFGLTFFEFPLTINLNGEENADNPSLNMEQVDTMMSTCAHLIFTPDGQMLVSGSSDGRVRIVDSQTGRYLHTMFQRSSITTMLITSDSQHLLTGGYRNVYIWNIGPRHPPDQQGQLLVKLTPHRNFITCMQLVRGDSYLITASLDKTVSIWSLSSRTTLCSFQYHCSIDIMVAAPDLSTISFIPEKAPTLGVLTLNKSGREVLSNMPVIPVNDQLIKAQAMALVFSSQQISDRSTTCTLI